MKFGPADFPKIRLSLLAAILTTVVGGLVVHFSLHSTKAAQIAQKAAAAEHGRFVGRLQQVRNEENEIKQKSMFFGNLQERGVIGDEQRLDWIELLKDIRERRRLFDLQYEISPQRPLDASPGSGFAFYASTMKLQVKLLHEEDLLRLLADLRAQARALIQVKSCHLSRLPRGDERAGSLAQLQADCQIDWVTLREAGK